MGEITGISWTHHSFNPWIGCTRVSNGDQGACAHCYAADLVEGRLAHMGATFGGPGKGPGKLVRTSESNWRKPLAWNKAAKAAGEQRTVFCASLADVADLEAPLEWFVDLVRLAKECDHLTWLFLTKRIGNLRKRMAQAMEALGLDRMPPNIAFGSTVVTQDEANRDIPELILAKAFFHPAFIFVSMEPLMGRVDLTRLDTYRWTGAERLNALTGELSGLLGEPAGHTRRIDWVIAGGESGREARPSHPDWFRLLRDQCEAAGIPFHFKQWGEWIGYSKGLPPGTNPRAVRRDLGPEPVFRVGKKAAGHLLDGVEHLAFPELRHAMS